MAVEAQTLDEENASEIQDDRSLAKNLNSSSSIITVESSNAESIELIENDAIEQVKNIALSNEIENHVKMKFMDFPFIEDEKTVNWIKNNRVVFVMRGLPGSGKSSIVKVLSKIYKNNQPIMCSADTYFVNENGDYVWNKAFLKDAHEASQNLMKSSVQEGRPLIVVDNTNVEFWEMRPYFSSAQNGPYTYYVIVVEPKTPWKLDFRELAQKNSHGVDKNTLKKKSEKFIPVCAKYYGWFLSPSDSNNLIVKANELFKSLYENCQEFKSSFAAFSSMLNARSAETYYNRDMFGVSDKHILHCTAKFMGFMGKNKDKNLAEQDKRNDYVTNVEEYLGQVQKLKIIGYFFTEHTFGCRIELTEQQLKLYNQDEDYHIFQKRQFGKPTNSKEIKDDLSGASSISEIYETHDDVKRFYPIAGKGRYVLIMKQTLFKNQNYFLKPVEFCQSLISASRLKIVNVYNGYSKSTAIFITYFLSIYRRAHITLGTAKGARAVNTGMDLLDVVLAEKNCCEANDKPLFQSTVESCKSIIRQYKPNYWVIYPDKGLMVDSLFTGYY